MMCREDHDRWVGAVLLKGMVIVCRRKEDEEEETARSHLLSPLRFGPERSRKVVRLTGEVISGRKH